MHADANPVPGDGNESSPAAIDAVADATGAALQADSARAVGALLDVPANEFAGADFAFRTSMLERFGPAATDEAIDVPGHPLARDVLATYRSYWRAALARPADRAEEEARLLDALRRVTGRTDAADFGAMEPLVTERLRLAGYHCLQGLTGPLRELMLWTRQEMRPYRVALPDAEHTTRVFLLDDFASLGWGDYATCGRRGTGGWATGDALYAVVPRYPSLDGEEFRVTFLGHETQHFADLSRFAGMPQWELEYRAKLVELAQATHTRARVLRKLGEDQGDDPASPHAYANKRVLAALVRRLRVATVTDLGHVDVGRLQSEAASELREDTWRRRATRTIREAATGEGPIDQ